MNPPSNNPIPSSPAAPQEGVDARIDRIVGNILGQCMTEQTEDAAKDLRAPKPPTPTAGEEEMRVREALRLSKIALLAIQEAHNSLFIQCCSNPIKNAWGKEVDVSALNDAHQKASTALALLHTIEEKEQRK